MYLLMWKHDGTYLTREGNGDRPDDERGLNKWTVDPTKARTFDTRAKAMRAKRNHDCDDLGLVLVERP